MQVKETINKGLERELSVVIPKGDMEKQQNQKLETLKDRVKINGFRAGKVPIEHVKKLYGKSVMAELVNEAIEQNTKQILEERKETAVQQPKISMTEDEEEAEQILQAKKDFEFKIKYEVMPEFEIIDFKKLKIERPVVDVDQKEVQEQIRAIAENNTQYETKKGKAEKNDRVMMDYVGKIDGEAFEGGTDTNANLVLGSNTFLPGFEDQLIGAEAGEERVVKVTFPENYPAKNLANQDAEFEVLVHEVAKPKKAEVNDELAKMLGLESLDKLNEVVKEQISGQYKHQADHKVKRQLLDALDEKHKFELPQGMVEQEFESVWGQVNEDMKKQSQTFEDQNTTEKKAREEYKQLAQRRVRLGLILGKVGEQAKIEVTEEELQKAIMEQSRQYPGREKEVYEMFTKNPQALGSLRAPIFEQKVVEHIVSNADVKDKKVTKEVLMATEDEEVTKKEAKQKKSGDKKPDSKKTDKKSDNQKSEKKSGGKSEKKK